MLRRLRIENLVLIREADLDLSAGLNAITGETGAGKTILAQAIGLLLGLPGDAAFVGPSGSEAYVEAEFDLEHGALDDESFEALADLRPDDEEGLVLARRIFADGRTRAYAWGRSTAREDLAAASERLIAMSGQFEQRRLARPSYQLDVLDAFVGDEQARRRGEARRAWRELLRARRRRDETSADAHAAAARVAELRALVEDTAGLSAEHERSLHAERQRLRHTAELGQAAAEAAEALAPDDGQGAADLVAAAERGLAPLQDLAPELARAGEELRDVGVRLREVVLELRAFLASLDVEPARLEQVESELERMAEVRRRFGAGSLEELLARAEAARRDLGAVDDGFDPAAAAEKAVADAEARVDALAAELRAARRAAAEPLSSAVSHELRAIGLADAEFRVELRERDLGSAGADDVAFLAQLNAGMPFVPVAETASGGELSRVALAIAAVAAGAASGAPNGAASDVPAGPSPRARSVMVFDEIDAGIGGRSAHAVGETLKRLSERTQVLTITHLPQIASVADRHFRVEKVPGDPTHTRIQALDEADRREEIERMLGGREFLAALR